MTAQVHNASYTNSLIPISLSCTVPALIMRPALLTMQDLPCLRQDAARRSLSSAPHAAGACKTLPHG